MSSQAYLFNDYWEDIGTIKSFFDANLALMDQVAILVFNTHILSPENCIYELINPAICFFRVEATQVSVV